MRNLIAVILFFGLTILIEVPGTARDISSISKGVQRVESEKELNTFVLDSDIIKRKSEAFINLSMDKFFGCAEGYHLIIKQSGWCSNDTEYLCVPGMIIPQTCAGGGGTVEANEMFGYGVSYLCKKINAPFLLYEITCADGFIVDPNTLSTAMEPPPGDSAFGEGGIIHYEFKCKLKEAINISAKKACIGASEYSKNSENTACCVVGE